MVALCSMAMVFTLQPAFNYQPDLCADGTILSARGGMLVVEPGSTEPYEYIVANAGSKTDTILFKAVYFASDRPDEPPSPVSARVIDNIELRWFKGTNDVTNKVMAGKFKLRKMPSGAIGPTPPLRAEFTAQSDATSDDDVTAVLIARSKHKPTHQDLWPVNVRVGDPPE